MASNNKKKCWISVFSRLFQSVGTHAFFQFQFPKTREIASCRNYFQKYRESVAVDSLSWANQ